MKKITLAVLVGVLAVSSVNKSFAEEKRFGLGVILGEPTGFTGKYWFDQRSAIDFGLSYSFYNYFLIYADYLYHWIHPITAKEKFFQQLNLYIGVGGVLFLGGDTARYDRRFFTDNGNSSVGLGLRIPFGAEWRPTNPPFGVFAELVPGMGVAPSIYPFFEGGIGIRWYF